jgi:hypothetical protein
MTSRGTEAMLSGVRLSVRRGAWELLRRTGVVLQEARAWVGRWPHISLHTAISTLKQKDADKGLVLRESSPGLRSCSSTGGWAAWDGDASRVDNSGTPAGEPPPRGTGRVLATGMAERRVVTAGATAGGPCFVGRVVWERRGCEASGRGRAGVGMCRVCFKIVQQKPFRRQCCWNIERRFSPPLIAAEMKGLEL